MRTLLAVAVLAGLSGPATAASIEVPAGTYAVDPLHTQVIWRIKHLGLSDYVAIFDPAGISATIELDPEDVAKSSLLVEIDAASVVTNHPGPEDFDGEIAGPKFLDAPEFPTIRFQSTAIEVTGETTAEITGDLTMKGVTLPATLNVELEGLFQKHPMEGRAAVGFSATGALVPTAYGVDFLVGPVLEDQVRFEIEADFLKVE